jgi:putative membrane protein
MKRLIMFAGITAALATLPAFAQGKPDKASQRFLAEAIEGNYAEVQMGQLAQKNGQSDGVKSFGQTLASDHANANQKATDAAKAIGISAPSGPNAKQKADYDMMAKMSGASFDKAFVKHMVADHKKDIRAYEKEAKRNDAAGQYAGAELPTLTKHLETAQSLSSGRSASR